jgi:hypothetical protein
MFGKLGGLAEKLFRPEVAAYNWMHDKVRIYRYLIIEITQA